MPLFEMTVGQGLDTVKCDVVSRQLSAGPVSGWGRWWRCTASWSPRGRAPGKFKMIQPQFEILPAHGDAEAEFAMLEVGRIVPVYESLGGTTAWGAKLGSKWLRRVIWESLKS